MSADRRPALEAETPCLVAAAGEKVQGSRVKCRLLEPASVALRNFATAMAHISKCFFSQMRLWRLRGALDPADGSLAASQRSVMALSSI
jgi:hypothetical protein